VTAVWWFGRTDFNWC